jgi:Zn/Cd-binding protein ZinT
MKFFFALFFICCLYSMSALAFIGMNTGSNMQATQPWWTKQSGSTSITQGATTSASVVADSSKNYYVFGATKVNLDGNILSSIVGSDYYITKYDTSGTKMWTIQNGANGIVSLSAVGIAIDTSNNLYVAGSVLGGSFTGAPNIGSSDGYLVKHDSSGNKIWARAIGAAGSNVIPYAVSTDSANNVYIAGTTNGDLNGVTQTSGSSTTDFFVVKYDSNGTRLWTRLLGVSAKNTSARALATDSSNNVYVGGYTQGGLDGNTLAGSTDFFITKYDSSGTKAWTVQLGVASKFVYGYALATDTLDNVYITGITTGGVDGNTQTGSQDFYITKYNSSGVKQWTKQLGVSSKITIANSIKTDSTNNVYVTGTTTGNLDSQTLVGTRSYFITKYTAAGAKTWTKENGATSATISMNAIAIDSSDQLIIAGSTDKAFDSHTYMGTTDSIAVKYDASGTKLWSSELGGSYSATIESVGVITDTAKNIYVTGYTTGDLDGNTKVSNTDTYITKYSPAGAKIWNQRLSSSLGTATVTPNAGIVSDSANNIYVAGQTSGAIDGNSLTGIMDLFVVKYDSTGTKLWTKMLGAASKKAAPFAMALDSSSNIYICGYTTAGLDGNTLTGTQDFFLTKYDSSGSRLWTRQMGAASAPTNCNGIAIDSGNNILLSGYTQGNLDGYTLAGTYDAFTIKYDSSGTKLWSAQIGVSSAYTYGRSVVVDSSDNVYTIGTTSGNMDGNTLNGVNDLFITKYNSSGTKIWTKQYGRSGVNASFASAVLSSSSIYFLGYTDNAFEDVHTQIGISDLLWGKINLNGTLAWSRQLGAFNSITTSSGICTDSDSKIYITGTAGASLDAQARTATLDYFLMKFGER